VPPEKSATTWRAPMSSKSSGCFWLAVGFFMAFGVIVNLDPGHYVSFKYTYIKSRQCVKIRRRHKSDPKPHQH
jgi:hypothetical protein